MVNRTYNEFAQSNYNETFKPYLMLFLITLKVTTLTQLSLPLPLSNVFLAATYCSRKILLDDDDDGMAPVNLFFLYLN